MSKKDSVSLLFMKLGGISQICYMFDHKMNLERSERNKFGAVSRSAFDLKLRSLSDG